MKYLITHKLNSKERDMYEAKGLYCYDLRDSDIGNDIASIEKYVLVNNIGSIITTEEVKISKSKYYNFVDFNTFAENMFNESVDTIEELMQGLYEHKALLYAEKNGIIEYKVSKNKMVYYELYFDNGYNNKYEKYKHTLNLDTMKDNVKLLYKRKED